MTEEFIMIEVLPVQSVLNGTAVAIVSLDQLHKEHRRHKRQINKPSKFRRNNSAQKNISVDRKFAELK